MIKVPFLHYKTLQGFLADLTLYGESPFSKKIVFIKDKSLIWTHRKYYGVSPDVMSDIENRLSSIEHIINNSGDTELIIQKFRLIQEFLDSIDEDILQDIISTINDLVASEENRATAVENLLLNRMDDAEDRLYGVEQSVAKANETKHIILEESEYEALTEYESNAIYFVLEPKDTEIWEFGDTFPITLT